MRVKNKLQDETQTEYKINLIEFKTCEQEYNKKFSEYKKDAVSIKNKCQ